MIQAPCCRLGENIGVHPGDRRDKYGTPKRGERARIRRFGQCSSGTMRARRGTSERRGALDPRQPRSPSTIANISNSSRRVRTSPPMHAGAVRAVDALQREAARRQGQRYGIAIGRARAPLSAVRNDAPRCPATVGRTAAKFSSRGCFGIRARAKPAKAGRTLPPGSPCSHAASPGCAWVADGAAICRDLQRRGAEVCSDPMPPGDS